MEEFHDIIIIGAGASGLMCGYFLGRRGVDAVILDKNESAGKKLRATGNGRCNFTNREMSAACYYGNSDFAGKVLAQVDDSKVIQMFEEIGILHRERDGCCYPYSGQASAVVELLVQACLERGVEFRLDTKVTRIVHKASDYLVSCADGHRYRCRELVMATGGKACRSLGGDGSGYKLCRSLSHHITELYPGLTGLRAEGREWNMLAGVRMQGEVTLFLDGSPVQRERGEIQIVRDGISGIPVFQLCRLAAGGLAAGKVVTAAIDFFPSLSRERLEEWITSHGTERLSGIVHMKWRKVVRERAGTSIQETVRLLKQYEVKITDTFGWERAQVTAGGVDADEVIPETMQSKNQEGLYLIGEILDVDGKCGGYNLHFAWSTAYICAQQILRRY